MCTLCVRHAACIALVLGFVHAASTPDILIAAGDIADDGTPDVLMANGFWEHPQRAVSKSSGRIIRRLLTQTRLTKDL